MAVRKTRTQTCPECGGKMRHRTKIETLSYKEHERKIRTTAWWCDDCGEGILSGEALTTNERAFQELKAEVDGVLGPSEVAEARSALGLSQRKAGELLGGGPRAFQKYESGKQAVSLPMSNLLRLLQKDPTRLQELIPDPKRKRRAS